MLRLAGLLTAALTVTACTDDELVATDLAHFQDLNQITAAETTDDTAGVDVELRYHFTSRCSELTTDFTATLDGLDVPILDRGSVITGEDSVDCNAPHLRLDPVPSEHRHDGAMLELEDASDLRQLDLHDALLPRTADSADGWSFHAGQQVTIVWSPAADLDRLTLSVTGQNFTVGAFDITHTPDGAFTFTLPANATTGTLAIETQQTSVNPALFEHHTVHHVATIAPPTP